MRSGYSEQTTAPKFNNHIIIDKLPDFVRSISSNDNTGDANGAWRQTVSSGLKDDYNKERINLWV